MAKSTSNIKKLLEVLEGAGESHCNEAKMKIRNGDFPWCTSKNFEHSGEFLHKKLTSLIHLS